MNGLCQITARVEIIQIFIFIKRNPAIVLQNLLKQLNLFISCTEEILSHHLRPYQIVHSFPDQFFLFILRISAHTVAFCQFCDTFLIITAENILQQQLSRLRNAPLRKRQRLQLFIHRLHIIGSHSLSLGPFQVINPVFRFRFLKLFRVCKNIQKVIIPVNSAAVLRYDITFILHHPRIRLRVFFQNLLHLNGMFPVVAHIVCIRKFLRISHQFINNRTAGNSSRHRKLLLHPVIGYANSHSAELEFKEMAVRPAKRRLNYLMQRLERNSLWNQDPSPDRRFTSFYYNLELISSHENILLSK